MQKLCLTLTLLVGICFQLSAALIAWDTANAVDSNWNNPANWVGGVVPGSGDDVIISGSAAMVDISTAVTILSIEIASSATVNVLANGVLTLNGGGTNDISLDMSSGSGTLTNAGTINVAGATDHGILIKGSFVNDGIVTVTGYVDEGIYVDGGSIKNNQDITVGAGSPGDYGIRVNNGGSFDNCGNLSVCDTTDDSVRVENGNSFSNSGDMTIKNSGDHGIELFGTFDNSGTLKITNSFDDGIKVESIGGSSPNFVQTGPGAFTNGGTLVIDGFGNDGLDTETVNGGSFSAGGTFEIGCLNSISELEIRCDMVLSNTVNFDVVGASSKGSDAGQGIDYDWIENFGNTTSCANGSSPTLDVTGAVAQFNLGGVYVPAADDCFTIVDGSGLAAGPFGAVVFTPALPAGLTWADCTTDATEIEICIVAEALPVELVSFVGEKSARGAQLYWTTASEVNNKGFDIERSTDSKEWTKIGAVRGNRDLDVIAEYNYLDKTPATGTNYYRLKQNDFDGNFEYSKTIALDYRDGKGELIAYPNPVKDVLNIDIDQDLENLEIQLIDTNGRVIWRNNGWVQTIPLNDLSSGVYLLSVESSSFQSTKMIIKE